MKRPHFFIKNTELLGGVRNFLLERGDKPEKGVGVDVKMGNGRLPL